MGLLTSLAKDIRSSVDVLLSSSEGKTAGVRQGYWPLPDEANATNNFRGTKGHLSAAQLISWVSVCCRSISEPIAMTPWNVYDADNNPTENKDLIKLLNNPNPFMTFFSFREILMWHLQLAGNAYIWKVKASMFDMTKKGKYSQLWLLNPACVEPQKSENNYIDNYVVHYSGGNSKVIPVNEIVHIKLPNPIDDRIGMGKIQANEMLYNTEYSAQWFNWQFFAKGGRPAAALIVQGSPTKEQRAEIEANFSKYQGVQNAHKFIVLSDDMDVKDIGLSQKDMAFIEQRKFSKEEIFYIFGAPMYEYANYASMKEQRQIFLQDTITPYLIRLNEAFTFGIVKDFEPDQAFYHDNVVKKDEQLYMTLAKDAVQNGLMTHNEARVEYLDLVESDDPALDEHYIPINLIPMSESSTLPDTTPPAKGIDGKKRITASVRQAMYRASMNTRRKIGKTIKKEMKTFFDEQQSRVLSALDGQKAIKAISADDIFNFEKESAELVKAIRKGHIAVIMKAIQDANGILGTEVDSSTSNPQVTARIGKLARNVTKVNNTTKDKISAAIKEGVDAGESIGELKKRVEEVFTQAKGYRAEMIARTESASAYGQGSYLSYVDAEIKTLDLFGCDQPTDAYPCNETGVDINDFDEVDAERHPQCTGAWLPSMS